MHHVKLNSGTSKSGSLSKKSFYIRLKIINKYLVLLLTVRCNDVINDVINDVPESNLKNRFSFRDMRTDNICQHAVSLIGQNFKLCKGNHLSAG